MRRAAALLLLLLAAAFAEASAPGAAAAQGPLRRLATVDSLRQYPGYFHLQNVVVHGEIVDEGGLATLRASERQLPLLLNDESDVVVAGALAGHEVVHEAGALALAVTDMVQRIDRCAVGGESRGYVLVAAEVLAVPVTQQSDVRRVTLRRPAAGVQGSGVSN